MSVDVTAPAKPLVYTPEEAAEILRVGRSKVYELISRKELKSIQIGRSRRIPRVALEEYVERQLEEAG